MSARGGSDRERVCSVTRGGLLLTVIPLKHLSQEGAACPPTEDRENTYKQMETKHACQLLCLKCNFWKDQKAAKTKRINYHVYFYCSFSVFPPLALFQRALYLNLEIICQVICNVQSELTFWQSGSLCSLHMTGIFV